VGWSVICYYEVVEGVRPNAHGQKSISVTILTSTAWRTPGRLVPYSPIIYYTSRSIGSIPSFFLMTNLVRSSGRAHSQSRSCNCALKRSVAARPRDKSNAHHLLRPVIKLGLRHPRRTD